MLKIVVIVSCISTVFAQNYAKLMNYEYYIEKTKTAESYEEALRNCQAMNATLVAIKSEEIMEFLMEEIGNLSELGRPPYSFYIGLRRNRTNNAFQWIDGTSLSDGFSDWFTGEPNNLGGSESCVTIGWRYSPDSHGYKWNDISCSDWESHFICQKNCSTQCRLPTPAFSTISNKPRDITTATEAMQAPSTIQAVIVDEKEQTLQDQKETSNIAAIEENVLYIVFSIVAIFVLVLILTLCMLIKKRKFCFKNSRCYSKKVRSDSISTNTPATLVENELYHSVVGEITNADQQRDESNGLYQSIECLNQDRQVVNNELYQPSQEIINGVAYSIIRKANNFQSTAENNTSDRQITQYLNHKLNEEAQSKNKEHGKICSQNTSNGPKYSALNMVKCENENGTKEKLNASNINASGYSTLQLSKSLSEQDDKYVYNLLNHK